MRWTTVVVLAALAGASLAADDGKGRLSKFSKGDDSKVTGVRAEERPPLERIATIELKGKAGTLDRMGADWKNHRQFVANQSNNTLDVVDVKNNRLVKQVAGQKEIHGIAYAADLDRIFVGNGEGVCNALDGRDYALLKSVPVPDADSVRYDPRTHRVLWREKRALP
ncbi:MAG TPA: hypothetical protein VG099_13285 [Gemmataceae bacterium]|jgi:DNA-binding beta-propeller fold protein YncE|nr:hypothetical protein [Gemmataceae bacterium]